MEKQWIQPAKLNRGDTVATISLSWGGAGDEGIRWRYEVAKERLQNIFGLNVVEMEHTLKGSEYLYEHPQKRAEDLMNAFKNPQIKAIFSCIGGYESVRMLPYIDFEIIRANPKIFMGYSDSTITHLICNKAGVASYYGPSLLADIAENVKLHDYTIASIEKTFFNSAPIGVVPPAPVWTSEYLPWEEKNRNTQRAFQPHEGYELLQGKGIVQGRLIGGCMEVLEMAKGTSLWPKEDRWEDAILFFETSEDTPDPNYVEYWVRNYGTQGILQKAKGILLSKPYGDVHHEAYKKLWTKVVQTELGLTDLPILCNMSFGHTEPMSVMPYGALAQIDCHQKSFTILESGVQDSTF